MKRGLLYRRGEGGKKDAATPSSASLREKKRRRRRREAEAEGEGNGNGDGVQHVSASPSAAKKVKFKAAESTSLAPTTPLAKPWGLASPVHKAAASALGSLMSGRGRSLKALTLFPISNPSKASRAPAAATPRPSSEGARRATHAVASETLRRLEQLTLALKAAGYGSLLVAEEEEEEGEEKDGKGGKAAAAPSSLPLSGRKVAQRLPRPAALVLAYDLLFGQGLRPVGPAERALLRAEDALRAAVAAASGGEAGRGEEGHGGAARASSSPFPLLRDSHPRSARVNALKWTLPEALSRFQREREEEEEEESEGGGKDEGKGKSKGTGKKKKEAAPLKDPLVDGVLLFPPRTDLHDHPAVLCGQLILQSRASCLPAVALAPEKGWTVVDACAAPGNKTTHLAALVGRTGRVLAFDRDPDRLDTLHRAAERAGASAIVDARVADFLKVDPLDGRFASVRAVLLDPSCSGSGTASADVDASLAAAAAALAGKGGKGAGGGGGGEGKEEEKRRRRVAKLASFQLAALKHALRFPNAERVAYSTCSVHAEENERVVAAVLAWLGGGGGEDEGEKKGSSLPNAAPPPPSPPPRPEGWRLARALPAWSTRGIPEGDESPLSLSPEDAAKVIRAHPATDGTDGFFVAVFER